MFGVRSIALFEAFKGLAAIVGASGLLLLTPADVQSTADRIVHHLRLDPASHYPSVMLHVASEATPASLRLIALGTLVYAGFRLAEAVGLWRDRSWAAWLGVVTGLIYVPFEVVAFLRHGHADPLIALLVNLAIVCYLGLRLKRHAHRPA